MTRQEFEDGVRAALDKLKFYPRESDFQFWIENAFSAKLNNQANPRLFLTNAEAFRRAHGRPSQFRRGKLPVAPEDGH